MSDTLRNSEENKSGRVRTKTRQKRQTIGTRIGRLGGRREKSLLEDSICRLREGETGESLRASGVDEMTISLAMICK